jgi:hypothetical protein
MTDTTRSRPVTRCRACGAQVDARLVVCPECGGCCPSCDATGLKVRRAESPPSRRQALARSSPCGKLMAMHEELGHALMEALWELDHLPGDADEAIGRIFAVTDDLEAALGRTRELDEQIA